MGRRASRPAYDDDDYHVADAAEHGQPEDNAFTHIGFFLAWLIRHDLVDRVVFDARICEQVRSGVLRPNELRDLVDGGLVAEEMNSEGVAFADAYYERYMEEFSEEFSDLPVYGVSDEPEYEARIAAVIDRAYAEWVKAGRPKLKTPKAGGLPTNLDPPPMPEIRFEVVDTSKMPSPHIAPDLEAKVIAAVGDPLDLMSTTARNWGLASINRALRTLGVSPTEATVLSGFGDEGTPVVSVVVVPGVSGPKLAEVFGPSEERTPGYRHRTEIVGGEAMRLSTGRIPPDNALWLGGWFTVDGYLAGFEGKWLSEGAAKATLVRLREALRS